MTEDIGQHGTGIGTAIHLMTSAPTVVYDIYPCGGASSFMSSATLLLPTPTWDTKYVAVTAWPGFTVTGEGRPSDVMIVAQADDTNVQVLPKAAFVAGGLVPASPAIVHASFAL